MSATDINIEYQKKFISDYFNLVIDDSGSEFNKSSFIESIILGLPLGKLIIDYHGTDSMMIEDGYERIFALKSFIKNDFKLENLKFLSILNGSKFSDLDGNLKRILAEVKIDIVQLMFMNSDLKFEILTKLD